jgi:hypothetical protein
MGLAVYILVALIMPSQATANELKDFSTDGCSVSPDGTPWDPTAFLDCCIAHDISYWQGGTVEDREAADHTLKACIEKKGFPEIANVYYYAVRMGGTPKFKTGYRWGYGWSEDRGYSALDLTERYQIFTKLRRLNRQ